MLRTRIAVLVSGGGTNLQSLIDAQELGALKSGEIALVISSSETAFALERAKKHSIPYVPVSKKSCGSQTEFETAIQAALAQNGIELVVLAGFMSILSADFVSKWNKRIINVHPSLIPSFCGEGFYGLKVHEAALKCGVKLTGATVHFVNEIPDGGEIILQKSVPVYKNDSPEKLQRRVMERAEWLILPRATELISRKILKEGRNYHGL
ncbi:MAG: phosphoribosylglycinamide formyltransferase [Oscillospiraceae bacterium]|nr:phosphoribosylglycinamide formyltransferase [Oscillospiraceae bacterium]